MTTTYYHRTDTILAIFRSLCHSQTVYIRNQTTKISTRCINIQSVVCLFLSFTCTYMCAILFTLFMTHQFLCRLNFCSPVAFIKRIHTKTTPVPKKKVRKILRIQGEYNKLNMVLYHDGPFVPTKTVKRIAVKRISA